MPEREVIRCSHCTLNQFMTSHQNCRRCRQPLIERPAPVPVLEVADLTEVIVRDKPSMNWGLVVKLLRLDRGYSQRSLADVIKVPRTYISKIENNKATPTLKSMERFATVFKVSPFFMIWLTEQT